MDQEYQGQCLHLISEENVYPLSADEELKFKQNHKLLYHSITTLGTELDYYKNGSHDEEDFFSLQDSMIYFRDAINLVLKEYSKAFPTSEVVDDLNHRKNKDTIEKLNDNNVIGDDVKKLFLKINHYGNAKGHVDEIGIAPSDFPDIVEAYDNFLLFLPDFLKKIPEPGLYHYAVGSQYTYTPKARQMDDTRHRKSLVEQMGTESILLSVAILFLIFLFIIYFFGHGFSRNTRLDADQQIEEEQEQEAEDEPKHYAVGETWTVEGQWDFTVDDVTATPYEDGDQKVTVDYSYSNLGYDSEYSYGEGLRMSLAGTYVNSTKNSSIIDSDGVVGTELIRPFAEDDIDPEYIVIGGSWSARQSYEIHSDGNTATLECTYFDDTGTEHSADFDLSW